MTLQEVKDQTAIEHGYKGYKELVDSPNIPPEALEWYYNRVTEIYARRKWYEACDSLRHKIELNWIACEMDRNEEYKVIVDTTNPEFKP